MEVENLLQNLLSFYKVKKDLSTELREDYRLELENDIKMVLDKAPHFRYGGSLAKGTANSDSCDIDLLCYYDSNYEKTVEDIYKQITSALMKSNYIVKTKNCAICVTGKLGESNWDVSMDIVPGKYTSNINNKDVYLWCNKDKRRLQSNPEKQIDKVKNSNCKDLIRLLKIFRSKHKFEFKSFYLELFAIDIVSPNFKKDYNLYDKLVCFCSFNEKIGNVCIIDPANSNNNVSNIHTKEEFALIREKMKMLYDVLKTNDGNIILDYINNNVYNLDDEKIYNSYFKDSCYHCSKFSRSYIPSFLIKAYYYNEELKKWIEFVSNEKLAKNLNLSFEISVPKSLAVSSVKLIVSNAGYYARKALCQRGNEELTKIHSPNGAYCIYYRNEMTLYSGTHFVQFIIKTDFNTNYYSKIFAVNVI